MRYSGSKRKYMKELLPIIMRDTNEETQFIDCFAGGMNVICEVPLKKKMAIEFNYYVFALWDAIKKYGFDNLDIPKNSLELTQEKYEDVRQSYLNNSNKYSDWFIGYVGVCASYGGSWFNGYAHFNPKKNEDHIAEAYNGLKKQVENFKNLDTTNFHWQSYHILGNDVKLPEDKNCVLFCDPPYCATKQYETDFDTLMFWDWVRKRSIEGYKVYVCEYNAPDDFVCIWQKKKHDGMGTTKKGRKQNVKIEKMFIYDFSKSYQVYA